MLSTTAMNRAFSADGLEMSGCPGALPQAADEGAPLALNRYSRVDCADFFAAQVVEFMLSPPLPADIIRACWILFSVIWLLSAISTKRSIYRESGARRLRYWILLVLAFLLLTRASRLPYPFNLRIISATATVQWLAAGLCIAGLAFCVWARATLGRNWSGTITLKEGHELIERGPYRLVRHPIYTGLLAMFLATALAFGHLGGVVAVILAFASFWIKLSEEEKLMLQQFPDQYRSYQQRAKCIIPFVLSVFRRPDAICPPTLSRMFAWKSDTSFLWTWWVTRSC